jgi:hypothetical protein
MIRRRTIEDKGVIGLKVKTLVLISSFIVLVLFSGCQKDSPKPELKKINLSAGKTVETQQVLGSGILNDEIPSLSVQYEPRGTSLFVECIVNGVTFREKDQHQKVGKIIVSVDGKKYQEARDAAFIIKDLSIGYHRIKLDIADLQNHPYGINKEFVVNIPEK